MIETLTTTTLFLAIATSFFAGVLVGWVISNHTETETNAKLKTMVAIVITLGWITSTVAGILLTAYTVSPLLHALMGAIVGYFFTDDGIDFSIGK